MVGYITASYFYFTGNNGFITVPSSTKFLVGEPAQVSAGGLATVWNNPNYATTAQVYSGIANQYQSLSGQAQFGGAMTWSINQDIDEGCQFSQNIAPAVSGMAASSIVCPSAQVADSYHGTINPNNC